MIMTASAAEFWSGKKQPYGVAYYQKDIMGNWKTVTYKEILAKKTARQLANLELKRRAASEIKPAFIWVFHNEFWCFGGWYVYIKTLTKDYALNFKNRESAKQVEMVMSLIPLGVLPFEENFEIWAQEFARKFAHVGFNRTNNQGIMKCRCVIINGEITDIIL